MRPPVLWASTRGAAKPIARIRGSDSEILRPHNEGNSKKNSRAFMNSPLATKNFGGWYHRKVLSHQYTFTFPNRRRTSAPGAAFRRKALGTAPDVHMELLDWGNRAMESRPFRMKPGGGSGEPYSHEGEEFLNLKSG